MEKWFTHTLEIINFSFEICTCKVTDHIEFRVRDHFDFNSEGILACFNSVLSPQFLMSHGQLCWVDFDTV